MDQKPLKNFEGRLDDLLPLTMPNGFEIGHMADLCASCSLEIEQDQWSARLSWLGQSCAVINLDATCPHCQAQQSRFLRIRSHSNGNCTMDRKDPTSGEWGYTGALPSIQDGKRQKQAERRTGSVWRRIAKALGL